MSQQSTTTDAFCGAVCQLIISIVGTEQDRVALLTNGFKALRPGGCLYLPLRVYPMISTLCMQSTTNQTWKSPRSRTPTDQATTEDLRLSGLKRPDAA